MQITTLMRTPDVAKRPGKRTSESYVQRRQISGNITEVPTKFSIDIYSIEFSFHNLFPIPFYFAWLVRLTYLLSSLLLIY